MCPRLLSQAAGLGFFPVSRAAEEQSGCGGCFVDREAVAYHVLESGYGITGTVLESGQGVIAY